MLVELAIFAATIGMLILANGRENKAAPFQVDDDPNYVTVQSKSALRNLATDFAYDDQEPTDISVRGSTDLIAERLKTEIQARRTVGGVEVTEACITHLAYAPDIAAAMLQRQQAGLSSPPALRSSKARSRGGNVARTPESAVRRQSR